MTKHFTPVILSLILLLDTAFLLGTPANGPAQTQTPQSPPQKSGDAKGGEMCGKSEHRPIPGSVYNDGPPTEPLHPPLNPTDFETAFVMYSIATKIKEVLYQEPCYCPCVRQRGHKSLLDCFMDEHGIWCEICHKEAIFAYEQSKLGKTPAEIRSDIAKGEAWKADIKSYVEANFEAMRAWKQ